MASDEARRDALRLVRQFTAEFAFAGLPLNKVTLKLLSGGRSEARIFKLTPFFGGRTTAAPVIVKLTPPGEGTTEKANYDAYARWGLPADCRPELLGTASSRGAEALCYSFAAGETLTTHLKRGDTAALDLTLRALFDPMRDTWFSPKLLRRERDIAQHYRTRYFTGPDWLAQTETALQASAAHFFEARQHDGRTLIGRHSFPSPRAVLFDARRARPYRSCILHGDLNTDNIVIASPGRAAMIDFLKTGRGHVYRDLVSLEASIRINYPRNAAAGALESERRIALGRRLSPDDSYAAAIQKIRAAARGYFGRVENSATYHFAVAAIALRLMRATDLSPHARARITASALWAAKALAGEPLA
mgnify:FL=1